VYGDLLGKISWIEYLYLLFRLELPSKEQAKAFETLAVAIANPGIRDHSVRGAMNGGVCGSTRASSLIAAISVGAGNLNGGREVHEVLELWRTLGCDLQAWQAYIKAPSTSERIDVWFPMEHIPGFDPNGDVCPKPVGQTLELLATLLPGGSLQWLKDNRECLEEFIGYPLAMSGVVGAALSDLGFNCAQAEMLYMLLRLPGAAAHSLEQEEYGWNQYPFFGDVVQYKPAGNSVTITEVKGGEK
jgi:citrate synthase